MSYDLQTILDDMLNEQRPVKFDTLQDVCAGMAICAFGLAAVLWMCGVFG